MVTFHATVREPACSPAFPDASSGAVDVFHVVRSRPGGRRTLRDVSSAQEPGFGAIKRRGRAGDDQDIARGQRLVVVGGVDTPAAAGQ